MRLNNKQIIKTSLLVIICLLILFVLYYYVLFFNKAIPLVKKDNQIYYSNLDKNYKSKEFILDYNIETKDLPPIKTLEEIITQSNSDGDNSFEEIMIESYKKNSQLASRFLPNQLIQIEKEFDFNNDGKKESIVSLCGMGANHCPDEFIIISENKQIYSTKMLLNGGNFILDSKNYGFYVDWFNENDITQGYCCPDQFERSYFKYLDGNFELIYEKHINNIEFLGKLD